MGIFHKVLNKVAWVALASLMLTNSFAQGKVPCLSDTLIANQTYFGYKSGTQFSIAPIFKEAHPFAEGFALVREKEYYTYINLRGEFLSQPRFVEAKDFSEGLAAVKMSTGWGFVNIHLSTVIPGQYQQVFSFSEGAAAVKKSKWHFVNRKNEALFEEESDTVVANFSNGAAIVGRKKDGWRYGLMSSKGKWLVPPYYISVKLLAPGLFSGETETGYYELLNSLGAILLNGMESVQIASDTTFLFEKEGRWNMFNAKGKVKYASGVKKILPSGGSVPFPKWKIIDTAWKEVGRTESDSISLIGSLLVGHFNNKKQILAPSLPPMWYQEIAALDLGYYSAKWRGKWGLLDSKGGVKKGFDLDTVYGSGPYLYVIQEKKVGLLDSMGNNLLDIAYQWIHPSQETGRILYKRGETSGYMVGKKWAYKTTEYDSLAELGREFFLGWKGAASFLLNDSLMQISDKIFRGGRRPLDTVVVLFDQDSIYRTDLCSGRTSTKGIKVLGWVNDTLAWAKTDSTKGVFHLSSDSLYVVEADTVWPHPDFSTRLLTRKGDTLGFAYFTGKWQTSYNRNYRYIGRLDHDFLRVMARKRFGFMDTSGFLRIATQYDSVGTPSERFFAVKIKQKWGVVDKKERFVIHPNYTKAGIMHRGKIAMWSGHLAMLVDENGQELFTPRFHDIQPSRWTVWKTRKGNLHGFLSGDGRDLFTPRFDKLEEVPLGYFIVRQYGKTGIFDKDLKEQWPLKEREIKWVKGSAVFLVETE